MKRRIAFGIGMLVGVAILMAYHATEERLAMKACLVNHSNDVCVTTLAGG